MSEEIYYDQNNYNGSEINENPNSGKTGFAVASLVLGIISVLCCCLGLGYITAPLSLIFGIIALVKRHGGTVMSIIGVVLSSICVFFLIICTVYYNMYFKGFFNDYMNFIQNAPQIIEEYKETGDLPDYIEKYNDPKYDEFWKEAGYDDFYDFFDEFVEEFEKSGAVPQTTSGTASLQYVPCIAGFNCTA